MRIPLVKILSCLCVAIALFVVPIFAGTTGKIVGKVTDAQTGEALPGVNVIVEGTTKGAAADLAGEFLILNVAPGVYTLRASMIGYTDARIANVKVSIDFTTQADIKLSSTVLEMGQEVTIVAEREIIRKDMTSSLSAVGSDEIQSMPVQEVADVLELQAGLVRDATGGIHVRGGRSGEVAYWVDGIAATDVYSGNLGVAVENSSVQELQVISGTFNAEYGQAMSGIVNIVTKDGGEKFTGEFSAYVGDYIPGQIGKYNFTKGNREFGLYKPKSSTIQAIRSPHPDSVEQINPLDEFNNIYNFQGSLSGPVPYIDKLTFFANLRYFSTDGYRFGLHWFTPQGEKGDAKLVPMEPFKKLSGQLKLAYQLTGSLKLTYNILGNDNKFRWYDRYYKYNPDGDYRRFENSLNHILGLTHVLTPKTFYEVKLTRFDTEYQHYVYKDPLKPVIYDSTRTINGAKVPVPIYVSSKDSYVHPDSANIAPANWSFQDGGMKMQHFDRNTRYFTGKLDLTSQITKNHQIKTGIEGRFYNLKLDEFNILPLDESAKFFQPRIPTRYFDANHNGYDYKPVELSAYLQDKMEFKDMIVNLGLRFDYFDADAKILKDEKNPRLTGQTQDSGKVSGFNDGNKFKDASRKYQASPRFGIAYPITDQGVIHFSYGHFFQMPTFRQLYGANDGTDEANPDQEAELKDDNFLSNPDLKPQKTVMYEIGLQQQLSEDIGMDVTLFYRDIRDWVGTGRQIVPYSAGIRYTQFENKDYSNVRGVIISFNKRYSNYFEASLDYSYMVTEGTASNPKDEFFDRQKDRSPRIQIIPLGWDQRHTLNGNVSIGSIDWRLSLLGRYWTGTPYTPTFAVGEVAGASAFSGLAENSARKPSITTFDLRVYKEFRLGSLKYSVFAYIYNLFDARGKTGVYDDTGDADYTLSIRNASSDPKRVSLLDDNAVHTEWYIEPRQIQIGLSLGF